MWLYRFGGPPAAMVLSDLQKFQCRIINTCFYSQLSDLVTDSSFI